MRTRLWISKAPTRKATTVAMREEIPLTVRMAARRATMALSLAKRVGSLYSDDPAEALRASRYMGARPRPPASSSLRGCGGSLRGCDGRPARALLAAVPHDGRLVLHRGSGRGAHPDDTGDPGHRPRLAGHQRGVRGVCRPRAGRAHASETCRNGMVTEALGLRGAATKRRVTQSLPALPRYGERGATRNPSQ